MKLFDKNSIGTLLLVAAATLPLAAHAADSDGDGVDDSIDAFPTKPEATTDTDGDGMPDSIDTSKLPPLGGFQVVSPWLATCSPKSLYPSPVCWSGSGSVSGYFKAGLISSTGGTVGVTVFVPSGTGTLSFTATVPATTFSTDTRWRIGTVASSFCSRMSSCNSPVYSLPAGIHELTWSAGNTCVGGYCQGVTSHTLNTLVSSNVFIASTLIFARLRTPSGSGLPHSRWRRRTSTRSHSGGR